MVNRGWMIWSRFWVVWSWVVWGWFWVVWSWCVWGWFWDVWSWLRWVIWGWFWVIRSWSWFWVIWFVVWDSFILNISGVSIFMVSMVGYDLGTAIGKKNSVFSRDNTIFILNLVLAKVGTRVFVFYTIFISKWLWWDFFNWMIWSWVVWFWGWMIWSWSVWGWMIWWSGS